MILLEVKWDEALRAPPSQVIDNCRRNIHRESSKKVGRPQRFQCLPTQKGVK